MNEITDENLIWAKYLIQVANELMSGEAMVLEGFAPTVCHENNWQNHSFISLHFVKKTS